jgi:hypothetical protein
MRYRTSTLEGKATQKKRRNDKADNKWAATTANNTPTMKNGGRGKNTHQPRTNTPSTKKTWAEVVKSGGINVQIVMGNGNLGVRDDALRIALSRHLTDGFTFMNRRIKMSRL